MIEDVDAQMQAMHQDAYKAHQAMADYHGTRFMAVESFIKKGDQMWAWYYLLESAVLKDEADELMEKAVENTARRIQRLTWAQTKGTSHA